MTGKPVLHDYWRSSSAYRVRIALNLKRVAYTRVPHDLLAGGQYSEAYRQLAPQGLVPALATESGIMTQSIAIIEWLDETYPDPPLLPRKAFDKAIVRAMMALVASDIQPLQNLRVLNALKLRFGADQEVVHEWARHWISEGLAALEILVGRHGRGFCHGDAPGLADCLLVPQMFNADRYGIDLSAFPALCGVRARCEGLDAFVDAHPMSQPDAPAP